VLGGGARGNEGEGCGGILGGCADELDGREKRRRGKGELDEHRRGGIRGRIGFRRGALLFVGVVGVVEGACLFVRESRLVSWSVGNVVRYAIRRGSGNLCVNFLCSQGR